MVKFTYTPRFFLIKSPENSFFYTRLTGRNSKEVDAKMAVAQGYSDVIFLRGGHLTCHFLRKAPRTFQSDFNDQNKNNCKGKLFWLTRSAAGFSGAFVHKKETKIKKKPCTLSTNLERVLAAATPVTALFNIRQ